jgi:hypothetical protein
MANLTKMYCMCIIVIILSLSQTILTLCLSDQSMKCITETEEMESLIKQCLLYVHFPLFIEAVIDRCTPHLVGVISKTR